MTMANCLGCVQRLLLFQWDKPEYSQWQALLASSKHIKTFNCNHVYGTNQSRQAARLQIADCRLPEPAVDSAPPNAPAPHHRLLKADLGVWWLLLVGQCAPSRRHLPTLYYSIDRLMNVSSAIQSASDPTNETHAKWPRRRLLLP
jgi:hypothetical protein